MPFVLDASVAGCWAFRDENHAVASLALERLLHDSCVVPAIWWFEVRNVLLINERRKRITEAESAEFLMRLSTLRITHDTGRDESEIFRVARTHRLTIYDAAYLALARRNHVQLATLDSELIRAAQAESVPLLQAS